MRAATASSWCANEQYWGKKPQIESLTFKILSNDAARVAALLSGDVQLSMHCRWPTCRA